MEKDHWQTICQMFIYREIKQKSPQNNGKEMIKPKKPSMEYGLRAKKSTTWLWNHDIYINH